MTNEASLHNIIQGCIAGKPAMQKELYYAFYNTLMKIAVRYAPCEEDAEQWVHDSFIKIFQNIHQFQFVGSFEGWIKRITTRVCIDHIRQRKTAKNEMHVHIDYRVEDMSELSLSEDPTWEYKYTSEAIIHLLQKLPDKQRMVFNLYVFESCSHKEIADELDIKENHSYWLLHQARKNLQSIFSQQKNIHL
jgi:RNA polymerase sigma-70 factor (ECF subfamily)